MGTGVGLGLALVPGRGGSRSSEVLGVRRAASGDGPGAWGLRGPLWPRGRRIHGRPGPTTPMAAAGGEARVKPGAAGRAPLRLVAAGPQRARAGRARPGPPRPRQAAAPPLLKARSGPLLPPPLPALRPAPRQHVGPAAVQSG